MKILIYHHLILVQIIQPTQPTQPTDPDRPPAEEVYDIRDESWLNNDERIFKVLQGDNPQWDLGDGTTSTDDIQHQYNTPGTYDITFTITIDGDQYTYTDTVAIVDLTLEYSQRVDILSALNGEDSHGTVPLGWDVYGL